MNHAYIKWKGIKIHTRNYFSILGSSSFLTFTTKGLLFYSFWSPSFSSEWAPFFILMRVFWNGRKYQKKKLFSFFLLNASQNSLFFSLFFSVKDVFTLVCSQIDYLPKLVIWREKILMGSLGSYENLVGLRSFNRET